MKCSVKMAEEVPVSTENIPGMSLEPSIQAEIPNEPMVVDSITSDVNTDVPQTIIATDTENISVTVPESGQQVQGEPVPSPAPAETGIVQEGAQEPETPPSEPVIEKPPVKKINVYVKTAQEKESFEVEENALVKDFKEEIAPKFNAEPDQLCLIFAGKILDDIDNLKQHNVKEGLTIHCVIRAAPRLADPAHQRPAADISATPFNLGSLGGLVGLSQLGMGSANFMEIQNQMQHVLLTNPNLLRNLLDNPLVQQLMSNPEIMRSLVTRNPQMQELIQRYVPHTIFNISEFPGLLETIVYYIT